MFITPSNDGKGVFVLGKKDDKGTYVSDINLMLAMIGQNNGTVMGYCKYLEWCSHKDSEDAPEMRLYIVKVFNRPRYDIFIVDMDEDWSHIVRTYNLAINDRIGQLTLNEHTELFYNTLFSRIQVGSTPVPSKNRLINCLREIRDTVDYIYGDVIDCMIQIIQDKPVGDEELVYV